MTRTRYSTAMTVCIMLNLGDGRVLFRCPPQGEVADLSHRWCAATHQANDTLIQTTLERAFTGGD